MMLGFEGGMRFVIHTAALGCSFNMSTQGAYVQDFPIKKSMNSSSGAFENTLIEYCKSYEEAGRNLYFRDKEPKLFQGLSMEPKCWPGLSTDRKMKLSEMVACFDFQVHEVIFLLPYVDVCVRIQSYVSIHTQILVTQVPGYYTDASRDKWGHLQVRRLLARGGAVFPPRKVSSSCKDVIVAQFTSFASLNENTETNSNPVSHLDCDQTTIPWARQNLRSCGRHGKKSRIQSTDSVQVESCPVVSRMLKLF